MSTKEEQAAIMAVAVAAAAEIAKNNAMYHVSDDASSSSSNSSSSSSSNSKKNTTTDHTEREGAVVNMTVTNAEEEEEEKDAMEKDAAVLRLEKCRERNREHARRTRLRKKAQLEALQHKVHQLETEQKVLKQAIEECNIATILIGLSSKSGSNTNNQTTDTPLLPANAAGGRMDTTNSSLLDDGIRSTFLVVTKKKRKRFVTTTQETTTMTTMTTSRPLSLELEDGTMTHIGGGNCKTHINWKSGVYSDQLGNQRQLSFEQLERLRRERNRMHAKLTRDRKKCFISAVEQTVQTLEEDNQRMRTTLQQVQTHVITPLSSPHHQSSTHHEQQQQQQHGQTQEEPSFSLSTA